MVDIEPVSGLENHEKARNYLVQKIEEDSKRLTELGISVTPDGHVDMDSFINNCYPLADITADKNYISRLKKIMDEKDKLNFNSADGELAEMFITICLNKYLSEDFVTVRTSVYDDIANGVDRLILDKNSDKVICGIDDLIANPLRFQEKMNHVANKNKKGGAYIKYGLRFEKNGSIKKTKLENVPVLCLPCPREVFNKIALIKDDQDFNAITLESCKFFAKFIAEEINMMHLVDQFRAFYKQMKDFSVK